MTKYLPPKFSNQHLTITSHKKIMRLFELSFVIKIQKVLIIIFFFHSKFKRGNKNDEQLNLRKFR